MRDTKYEFEPINVKGEKFEAAVVEYLRTGLRRGQSSMIVLSEMVPALYDAITGSRYDPFYDDRILPLFRGMLKEGLLWIPNETDKTKEPNVLMENFALLKLKADIKQNIYNLNKQGLYSGFLKESLLNVQKALEDY